MSQLNANPVDQHALAAFGQSLALHATLGNQFKQELSIPPDFEAIAQYAQQQQCNRAQTLLLLTSAWQLYSQAGQQLLQDHSTRHAPVPARDTRQLIARKLQQLLDTLLSQQRNEIMLRLTLAQWFEGVIAQQQIVPTPQVSEFVANLPKLFRPIAYRVLSRRAQWYVSQESQYDWMVNTNQALNLDATQVPDSISQDYWHSANLATQTYLLTSLRQQQPQAATQWLYQLHDKLKTEQLREFLAVLKDGLNAQDIDFLQAVLTRARRQQIKLMAASLLLQLPHSEYYQAFQAFFNKTIHYDAGSGISIHIAEQGHSDFQAVSGIDVIALHSLQKSEAKQQNKAVIAMLVNLAPLAFWQQLSPDFAKVNSQTTTPANSGFFKKLMTELTNLNHSGTPDTPQPDPLITALKADQQGELFNAFMQSMLLFQDQQALQLLLSLPESEFADKDLKQLIDSLSFATMNQKNQIILTILRLSFKQKPLEAWANIEAVMNQLVHTTLEPLKHPIRVVPQPFVLEQSIIDEIIPQLATGKARDSWNNSGAIYQLMAGLAQPEQLTAYISQFNEKEQEVWQLRQRLFSNLPIQTA